MSSNAHMQGCTMKNYAIQLPYWDHAWACHINWKEKSKRKVIFIECLFCTRHFTCISSLILHNNLLWLAPQIRKLRLREVTWLFPVTKLISGSTKTWTHVCQMSSQRGLPWPPTLRCPPHPPPLLFTRLLFFIYSTYLYLKSVCLFTFSPYQKVRPRDLWDLFITAILLPRTVLGTWKNI